MSLRGTQFNSRLPSQARSQSICSLWSQVRGEGYWGPSGEEARRVLFRGFHSAGRHNVSSERSKAHKWAQKADSTGRFLEEGDVHVEPGGLSRMQAGGGRDGREGGHLPGRREQDKGWEREGTGLVWIWQNHLAGPTAERSEGNAEKKKNLKRLAGADQAGWESHAEVTRCPECHKKPCEGMCGAPIKVLISVEFSLSCGVGDISSI